MYAHRRLYVENWEHTPQEDRYQVTVTRGGKAVGGIEPERIIYIEEDLMHWRKANHIHRWFVENVQNGQDDCGTYYVSEEQLCQLLLACEEVIRASKLVDGTVWAGTEYSKEHPEGKVRRTPGKVIENPATAERLLPTQAGCFFGSTEYDEHYLQDVVDTRNWIVGVVADLTDGVPGDIQYSSSW